MKFPYYITVAAFPSVMHDTNSHSCVDIEHGTVEHKDGWSLELLKHLVALALKHNQRFGISDFSGEHLMYPVRKYKTYQELVKDLYPGFVGSPFTCCYYFMGRWEELNYSHVEFMKLYNKD